ncbi:MAG: GcrA cell cycle regulator, partial [Sphingomonadales bacterium]|nr:GcrA cell cycle regulator [Sphingomonadales bacterium]
MSWTEERIQTLKTMWEGGQTASQIAEALGGVSRNAVIGKAHRLGLQSRPSPVVPKEAEAKASAPAAAPPRAPAPPPVAAAPAPVAAPPP